MEAHGLGVEGGGVSEGLLRRIANPSCHDKVEWRAVDGAGVCARFFLTVFASEQFRLELVFGHDSGIYSAVLLHWTPHLGKGVGFIVSKITYLL